MSSSSSHMKIALPLILAAASAAYTIHLVQHPNPQLRHSAAWIPFLHLLLLWILLSAQKVLNRSGGKWSVSWVPVNEHGEETWKDALLVGGVVAGMGVAVVRMFVGLDLASAVALLSLAIPMHLVDTKSPTPLLTTLAASAIAISIAATQPITTLHNRLYSIFMCGVFLGGTWYRRTQGDPAQNLVKAMSGKKTAGVALLGTAVLTPFLAVNRVERMVPPFVAVPYLLISAGLYVAAVAASVSSNKTNTRQTPLKTASAKSGIIALVLLFLATASPNKPLLLAQAFVFAIPAAALWLQGEPTAEQTISRNSSTATLYAPHEPLPIEDIEASKSPEEALFVRTSGRNERVRIAVALLVLVPVLVWLGRHAWVFVGAPGEETMSVRGYGWKREADYDIVVAYYDEDREILKETIAQVKRQTRPHHTTRTIVYAKGPDAKSRETLVDLRRATGVDEVVALKNVGREGETYLNHINRHYDSVTSPLAHQTFFIQPHFAWDWLFSARLEKVVDDNTGFVSFGPYLNASCTADGGEIDSHGQSHPRIAQIYSAFQGDLCPADGFAITWAGQFMASRKRILSNKLETYQNLLEFFHVPKLARDDPAYETTRKEWIWEEGWWNSEESNPTLGHALERSWPAVMRCSDVEMALKCQGENDADPEFCQCRDT